VRQSKGKKKSIKPFQGKKRRRGVGGALVDMKVGSLGTGTRTQHPGQGLRGSKAVVRGRD